MSNFIQKLEDVIEDCAVMSWSDGEPDGVVNTDAINLALNVLNSLGQNARRMLEIGMVQDELVKLGFEPDSYGVFGFRKYIDNDKKNIYDSGTLVISMSTTAMKLWWACANGHTWEYEYNSTTWQQDVLTKVKELINDATI